MAMTFAEIKKAVIDYATEVDSATKKVKASFAAISNAQNDMIAVENKWDDIETSINALSDESVKTSYIGQLTMLRTQRDEIVAMLTALDTAVTEAGLMLI